MLTPERDPGKRGMNLLGRTPDSAGLAGFQTSLQKKR